MVVLKDSEIDNVTQLDTVTGPTETDNDNIQKLLADIKTTQSKDLTVEQSTSYLAAIRVCFLAKRKQMLIQILVHDTVKL